MEEKLSYYDKKKLFWYFNFPFTLFLSCFLLIFLSISLAGFLCSTFPERGYVKIDRLVIAECEIATLVFPFPILFMIILLIAVWNLKVIYRNLKYKEMKMSTKLIKIILGALFWVLFLFMAWVDGFYFFIFFYNLFDFFN